jgi:ankyrin repeat protein
MRNLQFILAICLAFNLALTRGASLDTPSEVEPELYFKGELLSFCNAIKNNDVSTLERMIKNGFRINTVGKHNMTPLLFALVHNDCNLKTIDFLLQSGADPNISTSFEDFFISFERGKLRYSLHSGENASLISIKLAGDYFRTVYKYKACINRIKGMDYSPLDTAIQYESSEQFEIIKYLIAKGANVNELCDTGMTLLYSPIFRDPKVAIYLLRSGANPLVIDRMGISPIHMLAKVEDWLYRSSPDYEELRKIFEWFGESLNEAREDLKRRDKKSVITQPLALDSEIQLRKKRIAERKATFFAKVLLRTNCISSNLR